MKKLNKYQKRYIWNHKRASRENVVQHVIRIWAAESEAYNHVQRMLSAKHLMPSIILSDVSLMSSIGGIMGYNA